MGIENQFDCKGLDYIGCDTGDRILLDFDKRIQHPETVTGRDYLNCDTGTGDRTLLGL